MRRLMGYLRPHWPAVLVALTAIVSASVLQLAQPYLMKLAIDRYIATSDVAGMDRIALLFLGILLASFGSSSCRPTSCSARPADHVRPPGADLRPPPAPRRGLLRPQPGRPLMTRVTTDVDALNDLFTSGVVSVFGDIFTLAGS